MKILADVRGRVRAAGWTLQQTDVTIVLQVPRLAPHIPAMQARLAEVLGVDVAAVSLKAKTNEGMGFIGRNEGIAVMAVATLIPA